MQVHPSYINLYPSPWLELNEFKWEKIIKDQPTKTFKKNSIIFHTNDINKCAYIINKGRIRLSIYSENGDEQAIAIAQEGSMIGEISVFDNNPNLCCAIAINDVKLTLIPKKVLMSRLSLYPEIQSNLINNLVRKIRLLYSQIQDLSFRSASARVALTLIRLIKEYGIETSEGHKISIKFTHQEMANIIGLCRVSVSKIMSEMINNNIISKKDKYIIIKDMLKLYDLLVEK